MTDIELMKKAKTLKGNIIANAEKISFADACKIVLLSEFLEGYGENTDARIGIADLVYMYKHITVRRWWKFFF